MTVQKIRNLVARPATLRVTFGIVWVIDAVFKWQPSFLHGFMDDAMSAGQGQPSWLGWWFRFWMNLFMHDTMFYAVVIAIIESLIALALLIGYPKKFTYISGVIFSFLIWSVGEGFGGPYVKGSTDIGSAVMYIFIFWALYQLDHTSNKQVEKASKKPR